MALDPPQSANRTLDFPSGTSEQWHVLWDRIREWAKDDVYFYRAYKILHYGQATDAQVLKELLIELKAAKDTTQANLENHLKYCAYAPLTVVPNHKTQPKPEKSGMSIYFWIAFLAGLATGIYLLMR